MTVTIVNSRQLLLFYENPKDVVEVKSTIMYKSHPFFESVGEF